MVPKIGSYHTVIGCDLNGRVTICLKSLMMFDDFSSFGLEPALVRMLAGSVLLASLAIADAFVFSCAGKSERQKSLASKFGARERSVPNRF